MDNHPIPQDVTNFQFKLIGDMTLKQFGYVAGGVILAWIALASPVVFLLRFFLASASVLMGVILAFVPFEGRPSDIMLFHFMKALFSPTQFIYQKTPAVQPSPQVQHTPSPPPVMQEEKKEERKETVPLTATPIAKIAVIQQQKDESATPLPSLPPAPQQAVNAPKDQETALQEQVTELVKELTAAKQEEQKDQHTPASAASHEKVLSLEEQLQEVMKQKELLEKQLVSLQKSLEEKKQAVFTPSDAKGETTQHVKKIPKQLSTSVGTPLVPDVPNLITGVIKDSRGNVLPNILIEVKDKDNNPVRAFKTNQLGQFASATPLVNGTFTIFFEDPSGKHSFDAVEINADGSILLPLEIISVDAREKLRQELFGATNTNMSAAASPA